MFQSVLDSLLIFSGIHTGGSFGYGQWAVWFGWALLGKLPGGVGLTTLLRLIRSRNRLQEWRWMSERTWNRPGIPAIRRLAHVVAHPGYL